jgi:hypothetical protein
LQHSGQRRRLAPKADRFKNGRFEGLGRSSNAVREGFGCAPACDPAEDK